MFTDQFLTTQVRPTIFEECVQCLEDNPKKIHKIIEIGLKPASICSLMADRHLFSR